MYTWQSQDPRWPWICACMCVCACTSRAWSATTIVRPWWVGQRELGIVAWEVRRGLDAVALCQHPSAFTHFFTGLFFQSHQKLSPVKANVTAVQFHNEGSVIITLRETPTLNPKLHWKCFFQHQHSFKHPWGGGYTALLCIVWMLFQNSQLGTLFNSHGLKCLTVQFYRFSVPVCSQWNRSSMRASPGWMSPSRATTPGCLPQLQRQALVLLVVWFGRGDWGKTM